MSAGAGCCPASAAAATAAAGRRECGLRRQGSTRWLRSYQSSRRARICGQWTRGRRGVRELSAAAGRGGSSNAAAARLRRFIRCEAGRVLDVWRPRCRGWGTRGAGPGPLGRHSAFGAHPLNQGLPEGPCARPGRGGRHTQVVEWRERAPEPAALQGLIASGGRPAGLLPRLAQAVGAVSRAPAGPTRHPRAPPRAPSPPRALRAVTPAPPTRAAPPPAPRAPPPRHPPRQ